jgi:beta-carotene ketolase (CrtW type)
MLKTQAQSLSRLTFSLPEPNFSSWFNFIRRRLGLIIAILIITLYATNIFLCLYINFKDNSLWWLLILILGQTFLNTGLFIIAHDAMHGLICPFNPRLNHFIGVIAVNLYGLFSYTKLRERHLLHHRFPHTSLDPDYHNGKDCDFLSWYRQFMSKYLCWRQFLKLSLVVLGITYCGQISWFNLIFCWGIPLIFSSLQLFTFGTFLPHRSSEINSINLSPFWSFITCYNFGYHWEHHQYPNLPWWRLSSVTKK